MDPCPERTHPIIDIVVVVDVTHPNQSEKVHGGDSSTGHKPLSSHLNRINSSGTALLAAENSS